MTDVPEPSRAEKLRVQIGRMVAGNGLPPEAVVLRSDHETRITLAGQLDIRLISRNEIAEGKGTHGAQWRQRFETLAELNDVARTLPAQLATDAARLEFAADYFCNQPDQGWGQPPADVPLPNLNYAIGANETCPQCNGGQWVTCSICNGLRRSECPQCHGKKQNTCNACGGRGILSSGDDCMECQRRGVVACVTCQGQGETSCTTCVGKGQVMCKACEGKGQMWRQIIFKCFAQPAFKMMAADLPEDVMRHVRRLRPENLLGGRARITVSQRQVFDEGIRIHSIAEFPISHLEVIVADQPVSIVTIGEKAAILEATSFMDRLLAPSLDLLRRARSEGLTPAAVLSELGKIRFYREALSPGKNNTDLRRRYPFGISPDLLREVPSALQYLLSKLTAQPRMLAAVAFNAVSAIFLLYSYFLNATKSALGAKDILLAAVLLALNVAAITGAHVWISEKTLRPFGVRPKFDIKYLPATLGRSGFISLGVTAALCALAWIIR